MRTESVRGQQCPVFRCEKDKLKGTGLKEQCKFLIYIISQSRMRVVHISDCQGWSLTPTEFCQDYISGCKLMNKKHFCTGETPDWEMPLAKVLDFQKYWILLVHLLRWCFIFLFMCKKFPAAELVCSVEILSSLRSSVQLSKKLEGCEILTLSILGYN